MLAWVRTQEFRRWLTGAAGVLLASFLLVLVVESRPDDQIWATRVGIFGTIATVVGLIIALHQLFRTQTAAEAASRAATDSQRRTTATLAFSLVDQLPVIDQELNHAVMGTHTEVLRLVHQWRQTAGEIQRIVRDLDPAERSFALRLQESIALATASTRALTNQSLPIADAVGDFRDRVGLICNDVPDLKSKLAQTSGGRNA